MNKPLKICFISHSAGMGGAELSLIEIIECARKHGIECHVFLPKRGPLINELQKRSISYSILRYTWWMGSEQKKTPIWKRFCSIFLSLLISLPLAFRIRRLECDIVYTNTMTVFTGAIVARLLQRPHIWHIHEFGYEDHRLRFFLGERLSYDIMRLCSTIFIANSGAVFEKLKRFIPEERIRIVYNPMSLINIDSIPPSSNLPFNKRDNRSIRCIIVGSLQEGKRQEDAVLAIKKLVEEGIRAELIIVGRKTDSEYEKFLKRLVSDLNLDGHVKFTGYVENPIPWIMESDVLLTCSRNEAFGRVTVEGMLCGKPVIGANSGGTSELIMHGQNGLLYKPCDPEELASCIRFLYEHPDLAVKMGENGRMFAIREFNEEKIWDKLNMIFDEVIQKGKPDG